MDDPQEADAMASGAAAEPYRAPSAAARASDARPHRAPAPPQVYEEVERVVVGNIQAADGVVEGERQVSDQPAGCMTFSKAARTG